MCNKLKSTNISAKSIYLVFPTKATAAKGHSSTHIWINGKNNGCGQQFNNQKVKKQVRCVCVLMSCPQHVKVSLEVFLVSVCVSVDLFVRAGLCLLCRWDSMCMCMCMCLSNKQWSAEIQPLWRHSCSVTVRSCQQLWLSVTDSVCWVARLRVVFTTTHPTLSSLDVRGIMQIYVIPSLIYLCILSSFSSALLSSLIPGI